MHEEIIRWEIKPVVLSIAGDTRKWRGGADSIVGAILGK